MNGNRATKNDLDTNACHPHALTLDTPCKQWVEALPLGNGIIGVMENAALHHISLDLNHHAAWSGEPHSAYSLPPAAHSPTWLHDVRSALDGEDYEGAETLLTSTQTTHSQAFLPLGTLHITGVTGDAPLTFTTRRLDFATATATAQYTTAAHDTISHTTWVQRADSYPAPAHLPHPESPDAQRGEGSAIIHRIINNGAHPVDIHLEFTSQLKHALHHDNTPTTRHIALLLPTDVAPTHENTAEHVTYGPHSATLPLTWAATDTLETCPEHLWVPPHGETSIIVTMGSPQHPTTTPPAHNHQANGQQETHEINDITALCNAARRIAQHPTPHELHARNITAHSELYDRCSLHLGNQPALTRQFHMGRYLAISGWHPQALPLTLQGLWNAELPPPWSSNYTLNINSPMNYWALPHVGLGCATGNLQRWLINAATGPGAHAAKQLYDAPGFVLHHNSDRWGHPTPVGAGEGDPAWSYWPLGGIWLTVESWRHTTHGDDAEGLRDLWPAIEGAGQFAAWWLQDRDGTTVSSPSTSPEHCFTVNGTAHSVSQTATMDIYLFRELAKAARHTTNHLIEQRDLREIPDWLVPLEKLVSHLPEPRITADGQLAEWLHDYPSAEPTHRHVSHLIGLYPLRHITAPHEVTGALASMRARGPESTGWALAWRIALGARARDTHSVEFFAAQALRPAQDNTGGHRGGIYPSLLSAHPPFQIDGNLGLLAGMCEALVDANNDDIELLPALPASWDDGSIHGIVLPGHVTLTMTWHNSVPRHVTITNTATIAAANAATSNKTVQRHLRFNGHSTTVTIPPGETVQLTGETLQKSTTTTINLGDSAMTHRRATPPRKATNGHN